MKWLKYVLCTELYKRCIINYGKCRCNISEDVHGVLPGTLDSGSGPNCRIMTSFVNLGLEPIKADGFLMSCIKFSSKY